MIRGQIEALWRAWCRFWFEPRSTSAVALYRILFGALVLQFIVLALPDLLTWYGPDGPFTAADAARLAGKVSAYSFLIRFPQRSAVIVFFAVFGLAAFCLTIGLFTRLSAMLVFAGLVSIGHRNPLILNGGDTFLRIMAFYLILAPCGTALSVDRLIARARGLTSEEPAPAPPWSQRLMQVQVALVYGSTVLLKLRGHA